MRRSFVAVAITACLLVGWGASAQQQGVRVSGTVEDEIGGLIPGANLKLVNRATGEERAAVADQGGEFAFDGVAPGKYALKGEFPGFEPGERGIEVTDAAVADVKLKLAISLKEAVEVTDNSENKIISTQANLNAVSLDNDLLRALPTESDDILPVISNFLSPAAQGTEGLVVVIDGQEGTGINLPIDAIRRVTINKSPYTAASRRPGEGRAEITTRDGSRRRYDGTFSYSTRNSRFDARNTFSLTKPPLQRHFFSGSFGGPVPRMKTGTGTFFVSLNDLAHNESLVSFAITPQGPLTQNVATTQAKRRLFARFDYRPDQLAIYTGRYYNYSNDETNNGLNAPFVLPEQGYDASEKGHKFLFSARNIFSPRLINELRASLDFKNERQGALADAPTIIVRGAFIGGPSSVAVSNRETTLDIQNTANYTLEKHTLRFGGGVRQRFETSVNETNFAGTYYFQDIPDYLARRPFRYIGRQGDPAISYSNLEVNGFFEDEIKLTPWLNVTAGLRYDWQRAVSDYNNFSPRLAFALAPGTHRLIIRGGAGFFYERLPESATELTAFEARGTTRTVDISNPSFPNPFGSGRQRPVRPSAFRLAPDLTTPYIMMQSVSAEYRLWHRSTVTVDFQRLRGRHLLRQRNINAPLDLLLGPEYTGVFPYPEYRLYTQLESSASMKSDAVKVSFSGRLGKWHKSTAQYTFSRSFDDTGGTFTYPANSYDLKSEWGRSNLDQRHRFSYVGTFELPLAFRFGAILNVASGVPFDIITGFDDNGDNVFYDRPPGGTRNTGQGPTFAQLDVRLTKLFKLPTPFRHKEGKSDRKLRNLEISIDAFNVFNHPNTPSIVGELQSQVYGQARTAKIARTLQFGVKYSF